MEFYGSARATGTLIPAFNAHWRASWPIRNSSIASEREPAEVKPGAIYRIADLELASRLSFFLWSSAPDDALLQAAVGGRLHEPAVLREQTLRMLRDPKSDALVTNFASQWLMLRDLEVGRSGYARFRRESAACNGA